VKRELHRCLALTESLEQQLPSSRRLPIKELNLEVTMEGASVRGLQLQRCWRHRETGGNACTFGDKCFHSHAYQCPDGSA
jgi:hypothetical protein